MPLASFAKAKLAVGICCLDAAASFDDVMIILIQRASGNLGALIRRITASVQQFGPTNNGTSITRVTMIMTEQY